MDYVGQADWLNQTIARQDEFFGKRGYEKDVKTLKKTYSFQGW